MATKFGIQIILSEESYTSKASFLDNDEIPVYDGKKHTFSGEKGFTVVYISLIMES